MRHTTVLAKDLKVGDVLCPYENNLNLHFHYPITKLNNWEQNHRIGIHIEGTFQPCDYDTEWTIVVEDDES